MAEKKKKVVYRYRKPKRGRKKSSFTLPIAVVTPIAASTFIEGKGGWGGSPLSEAMAGRYDHAFNHLVAGWLGYSIPEKKFDFVNAATYTKLTLVGLAIHWILGKLGVNRALGRAKVPVIRI